MALAVEQLLLWIVVGLGMAITVRNHAPTSIVTAASVGMLVYSVPAITGLGQPLESDSGLQPTSSESIAAVGIAWVAYVGVLLAVAWRHRRRVLDGPGAPPVSAAPDRVARQFVSWCAALAGAITVYLMLRHGALFFLIERDEISGLLGNEYLIWKWLSVLGLIGSFATRRWLLFGVFAALMAMNLVVGDRTGPVIALVALGLLAAGRHSWGSAVRAPRVMALVLLTLGVVFFAKRAYIGLKSPELGIGYLFAPEFILNPAEWVSYWEPFATHQILADVIAAGLRIEPMVMIAGALGQFLLIPSAFGIDSSSFNVILTRELYPDLNFGVGYNFLAQGHALAGIGGVALFGGLFGLAAVGIERLRARASSPWSWLWLLIGVLVAVYIHRNSFENELALLRQAVIAFALAFVPAFVLGPRPTITRPLAGRIHRQNGDRPVLSVLIPTRNRRALVVPLVRELLAADEAVEVCVHVDGDDDGTVAAISELRTARLSLTTSEHRGRASALRHALAAASGRYVMFFDDDDSIDAVALRAAIDRLRDGLPSGYCGFVFHMRDEAGRMVGSEFPRRATNFAQMRLDDRVAGGKREIVLADLLREIVALEGRPARGRWPSSLLWTRLALDHDVETVDEALGTTRQLPGGMTSQITRLRIANPRPMYELQLARLAAYRRGRFRSRRSLALVVVKAIAYAALCVPVFIARR